MGKRRWQGKHKKGKINYTYWNESQRAEVRGRLREAGVERGDGEAEAGPETTREAAPEASADRRG